MIIKYGFVEGQPIYVNNSEGTYEANSIKFDATGIYLERTGVDRVFIPWCNVVRVYQIENVALAALATPSSVPLVK